jgi:hypothetical protein
MLLILKIPWLWEKDDGPGFLSIIAFNYIKAHI